MVSRNYMFRVSDKIKLTEAFEYQIERIKSIYTNESFKISENEDLMKYIGELAEKDESIANRSSISFIRKRQTMRQSLKSTPPIIGDVASCIRPEDYLTMA